MSRRLIDCFYPILLAISIAAMLPIPSIAGNPFADGSMVPVTDFPLSGSLNRPGECCPVDWGTHDSAPSHRIASLRDVSLSPSGVVPSRTMAQAETKPQAESFVVSDSAGQALSISTAMMAFASVRVQQIVEPFAVVGPRLAPSRESLIDFLDACNQIAQSQSQSQSQPQLQSPSPLDDSVAMLPDAQSPIDQIVSIDRLLDSLAADEPVDARVDARVASSANYVEVRHYVERADAVVDEQPSIFVAKKNPLVGGSAIVATLGSGPFAGDLGDSGDAASGQLRLWSVFPTVTRPFCVRHRLDHFAIDSLSVVSSSTPQSSGEAGDRIALIGSVDAMLAQARSSMPSSVQLASHRAQADAIVAAASTTLAMAKDLGIWAAREDASAKRIAIEKASQVLSNAVIAKPVSADMLRDMGRGIVDWTFAGNEIASQVVVNVARRMPERSRAPARQQAAAKLANAEAGTDRQ